MEQKHLMFVEKVTLGKALRRLAFCTSFCAAIVLSASSLYAQDQNPPAQDNGKPKTDTPVDSGGPTGDVGPYVVPKKKDNAEPPPPPPSLTPKKVEGMPDYSIKVNVPLVNVDVMVTASKNGQFISNLKKENFRILEDGVPQTITNFNITPAPITAVLLVEFASTTYPLLIDSLNASYAFAASLKKDDWIAIAYYDMQPHILVDFTQDKRAVYGALNQMRIPGFSETDEFDAMYDMLDRLDRVEGKKYLILVTTGIDTFSKLTLDKITKKIKETKDITIFPISIGWALRNYCETAHCTGISHGIASPNLQSVDYLQADNELRNFAAMTGGRAYFPRFQAEFAEIFRDIGTDIRNQYSIAYHPTNAKLDGTYRKLKVQIVAPDGGPLKIQDQKGKDVKVEITAREGYTAKNTVE